jgi:hypothetical protein
MRRFTRPLALAAGAAVAVGAALGAALALPTVAGAQVAVGGLPDIGTVTLRTGSTTGLSYVPGPDSTVAAATQGITSSNSALCTSTRPGFLAVTGANSGTTACFGLRGFGDGPGGTPSLYLNPNTDAAASEALVLTLAGPLADFEFDSFTFDLEAVNVPTAAGGAPEVVVEVRDSSKPSDPALGTIPLDLSSANRVVSSPPNFRVPVTEITTPGDQLVLRPQGNVRFQLEGDTSNTGSIFTLTDVTDVVPCGTTEITPDGADATLTVTTGEACAGGEAVSFTRDGNTIEVLKEPSDATFTLEITSWQSETAAYPVPATTIDYFDGAGEQPMTVCARTGGTPSLPADFADVDPTTPIKDGWCVASQSFELVTDGDPALMQVTETLYGQGDPRFAR